MPRVPRCEGRSKLQCFDEFNSEFALIERFFLPSFHAVVALLQRGC
jgi:hypothetical protein